MTCVEVRSTGVVQVAWLRRSDGRIGRYAGFKAGGPRTGEKNRSKCKEVLGVCRAGPPICMGAKSAQKCPRILGAMIWVQCRQKVQRKGPMRKEEKMQGEAQNQNRVSTTCMGVVGMYRDQRNAKGRRLKRIRHLKWDAAYSKCWTRLAATSNVGRWNSSRPTQVETKMQKTCNANLENKDMMQCKSPRIDRACWEIKTQGPEIRSKIKAIFEKKEKE